MRRLLVWICALTGCRGEHVTPSETGGPGDAATGDPSSSSDISTSGADPSPGSAGGEVTGSSTNGAVDFDLGTPDAGTFGCVPVDDDTTIDPCREHAPADAFDPEIQWTWTPEGPDVHSGVAPLVANLNDDNADGVVDTCDVPDVVVVAGPGKDVDPDVGHAYVLDGATGMLHFAIEDDLDGYATPALGDLDGDDLPELVFVDAAHGLRCYGADGVLRWTWSDIVLPGRPAIAIANVDAAGAPEILVAHALVSAQGETMKLFVDTVDWAYSTTTAADLDDDGDLEVILGNAAFHHDGPRYYGVDGLSRFGLPAVADVDGDGAPEVVVTGRQGITVVEHDGTVSAGNFALTPTGDAADDVYVWLRPSAIHDFDGDGTAELATSSLDHYSVFAFAPVTVSWSATVLDASGIAGGTAFDFLGDGLAEAMYADETSLFVFDEHGDALLQVPHASDTYIEFPVVADIDNDGSAEILVVSNDHGGNAPTLQAIRDVDDRWIAARRIWNQHTYHVTNVHENGAIPVVEPHHWERLNTFRTQAQIGDDGLCRPAG